MGKLLRLKNRGIPCASERPVVLFGVWHRARKQIRVGPAAG
jgi:hypothetical protein